MNSEAKPADHLRTTDAAHTPAAAKAAALIPVADKWAVIEGSGGPMRPEVAHVTKVMPQTFSAIVMGRYMKHRIPYSGLLAQFDDEEQARLLVQKIDGVRGEMQRRQRAASEAAGQQLVRLLALATGGRA